MACSENMARFAIAEINSTGSASSVQNPILSGPTKKRDPFLSFLQRTGTVPVFTAMRAHSEVDAAASVILGVGLRVLEFGNALPQLSRHS